MLRAREGLLRAREARATFPNLSMLILIQWEKYQRARLELIVTSRVRKLMNPIVRKA